MLTLNRRAAAPRGEAPHPGGVRELPFETRCKSRFRAQLADGQAVAVIIERGQVLRGGDRLQAEDGTLVEVRAAPETVSTARAGDARGLLRAAFHLGNRHVALQLGDGWLRYLHDHVLDEMLVGLGLRVWVEQAPFEPESGAYAPAHGGHGHAHSHGHDHC